MRPEKQYAVQEIKERLGQADSFVLTRFGGLTAEKMNEFRGALYEQSASYMVVKNRLLKIAAKEAGLEQIGDYVDGSVGIILGPGEYSGYLKELVKFNKANELPEILGGYLEQQYFAADNVKAMASLPSKEVLQAKLLGALQAPISSFVSVLAQRLVSFVRVLDAIAKKRAEGGEAAAEQAEQKAEETTEAAPEAAVAETEKAEAAEEKVVEEVTEEASTEATEERPAEAAAGSEKAEAAEKEAAEEKSDQAGEVDETDKDKG